VVPDQRLNLSPAALNCRMQCARSFPLPSPSSSLIGTILSMPSVNHRIARRSAKFDLHAFVFEDDAIIVVSLRMNDFAQNKSLRLADRMKTKAARSCANELT
jgi:hypothetical protein